MKNISPLWHAYLKKEERVGLGRRTTIAGTGPNPDQLADSDLRPALTDHSK